MVIIYSVFDLPPITNFTSYRNQRNYFNSLVSLSDIFIIYRKFNDYSVIKE